jgi:hypothetical protein
LFSSAELPLVVWGLASLIFNSVRTTKFEARNHALSVTVRLDRNEARSRQRFIHVPLWGILSRPISTVSLFEKSFKLTFLFKKVTCSD